MAAQSGWSHASYAEVAVDAAVGPERTFTYAIPVGMQLFPGQPVLVPLLSRRVGGVVFALSDVSPKSRVFAPYWTRSTPSPSSHRTSLSLRVGSAARPAARCTRPPPSCFLRTSDAVSSVTSACLPRMSRRRLTAKVRTPSKRKPAFSGCCDAGGACLRRRCNARWGALLCVLCGGWCGPGWLLSGGSCRGRRLGPPSTSTCGSPSQWRRRSGLRGASPLRHGGLRCCSRCCSRRRWTRRRLGRSSGLTRCAGLSTGGCWSLRRSAGCAIPSRTTSRWRSRG